MIFIYISAGILTMAFLFVLVMIYRNKLIYDFCIVASNSVGAHAMRLLNGVSTHAELDSVEIQLAKINAKYEVCTRSYINMVMDVRKWKYEQFFPQIPQEEEEK